MENKKPIIKVQDLNKHFIVNGRILKAANNINFEINKGETLALVGESGSGKSTVGKTILRLFPSTSGKVFFKEQDIFNIPLKKFKCYRKKMQMIFQDPYACLNPRMTVKEIIEEPLKIHKIKEKDRTKILLDYVNLPISSLSKFPHEFSGGQRQRIGIARALCLNPDFLILDEPVSALDVSIQAQIINLLKDLQKNLHLSFLFISHDLAIVKYISTKIAVMHLGEIVEIADTASLFQSPKHPYTQALLNSVTMLDFEYKEKRLILKNEIPSSLDPLKGCCFSTRCPYAQSNCFMKNPPMTQIAENHSVACYLH